MTTADHPTQPVTGSSPDETSLHVRRAHQGDAESTSWLVRHFSPLLRLQAEYRLPATLRHLCGPEDLVQDVWLATLPRLADLHSRGGRLTPVLLRFLGTTLLNKVNNLITRHLQGRGRAVEGRRSGDQEAADLLKRLPAEVTSVVQEAQRHESSRLLQESLARLGPAEREIVVLRGVEQLPNQEVADFLGLTPSGTTRRYQRALASLRTLLPRSVFEDLPKA